MIQVEWYHLRWTNRRKLSTLTYPNSERLSRGRKLEKVHDEIVDMLNFNELKKFWEKEQVSNLRPALQDFLHAWILGAILTIMGFLIVWL